MTKTQNHQGQHASAKPDNDPAQETELGNQKQTGEDDLANEATLPEKIKNREPKTNSDKSAPSEPSSSKESSRRSLDGPDTSPTIEDIATAPSPDKEESNSDKTVAKPRSDGRNEQSIQQQFIASVQRFELPVSKSYEPTDRTIPLPKKMHHLPTVQRNRLLRGCAEELLEHRVLAITGAANNVNEAAARAIMDSPSFRHAEQRFYQPSPESEARHQQLNSSGNRAEAASHHDKSNSLDQFTELKIGHSDSVVLLIHIRDASTFLDSAMTHPYKANFLTDRFEELQLSILLQIDSSISNSFYRRKDDFPFPHIEIPFLRPILEDHFGRRVDTIEKRLLAQRQQGLWPRSDTDFYRDLRAVICQGLRKLEDELDERQRHQTEEAAREFSIAEFFEESSELHKTAMFVGTLFREINPTDFLRVLTIVFSDRRQVAKVSIARTTKKGKLKIAQQEALCSLLRLWKKDPDGHLRHSKLHVMSLEDGRHIVKFKRPKHHQELLKHLWSNNTSRIYSVFQTVIDKDTLLAPETSPELVRCVSRLFIQMSIADPGRLEPSWLFDLVFTSHNAHEADLETKLDREPDSETYQRIADLLRDMLEHHQLTSAIDRGLAFFLERKSHSSALDLVLEVADRLRFDSRFKALYWMKRLIDESPPETRDLAMESLSMRVLQPGQHAAELLEQLSDWLPRNEAKSLPASATFSLIIIGVYTSEVTISESSALSPAWPPDQPLLRVITQDSAQCNQRTKRLVRWLFHPSTSDAILQFMSLLEEDALGPPAPANEIQRANATKQTWDMRASVLESWCFALQGAQKEEAHPESSALVRSLLTETLAITDYQQQALLLASLRTQRQQYTTELQRMDRTQTEKRLVLRALRIHSLSLEQQLKSARLDCMPGARSDSSN